MKARDGQGAERGGKDRPQLDGPRYVRGRSHSHSDGCRQRPLTVADVVKAVAVLGERNGSTFTTIRRVLQREWERSVTTSELKQTLVRAEHKGKIHAAAQRFFLKIPVGSNLQRCKRHGPGARRPSRRRRRRSRRRRRQRRRRTRRRTRRRRRRPRRGRNRGRRKCSCWCRRCRNRRKGRRRKRRKPKAIPPPNPPSPEPPSE